jgi:hypothetical protein
MKIAFERTPTAICAVLTDAGECDRIITVARPSDAIDALALGINSAALKPLDALFSLPRVVCVEIERREGGWRVACAVRDRRGDALRGVSALCVGAGEVGGREGEE